MFVGLRKGKKNIKSVSLSWIFYFTLLSFFLLSKNAG